MRGRSLSAAAELLVLTLFLETIQGRVRAKQYVLVITCMRLLYVDFKRKQSVTDMLLEAAVYGSVYSRNTIM